MEAETQHPTTETPWVMDDSDEEATEDFVFEEWFNTQFHFECSGPAF